MLAALLFDLDGTLANTDPIHMQAWREELAPHGLQIDEPFYRANISGRLNPHIVADLLPELDEGEASSLIERKEARFRDSAARLERLAGLDDLLRWAGDRGLDIALVTNAPADNARFMLSALGLSDTFPLVVLGADAPPGKPDPAPYRKALERLGVPGTDALAFEDSEAGVRSASGAGIEVVGVATTHPAEALHRVGAHLVVPDFEDERLWSRLRERAG